MPTPVVVVEVLSPSTGYIDAGTKLAGYFQVPSIRHYLIVDPLKQTVIHHQLGETGVITTRIVREGRIEMTLPGIGIALADLF